MAGVQSVGLPVLVQGPHVKDQHLRAGHWSAGVSVGLLVAWLVLKCWAAGLVNKRLCERQGPTPECRVGQAVTWLGCEYWAVCTRQTRVPEHRLWHRGTAWHSMACARLCAQIVQSQAAVYLFFQTPRLHKHFVGM